VEGGALLITCKRVCMIYDAMIECKQYLLRNLIKKKVETHSLLIISKTKYIFSFIN